MRKRKIHPELLKQIQEAKAAGGPVDAVFYLKPETASKASSSPEYTQQTTSKVFNRVTRKLGVHPHRSKVFSTLGSFALRADPPFVEELLKQPEIQAAIPNRLSQDGSFDSVPDSLPT
jgi:hypothetical protein